MPNWVGNDFSVHGSKDKERRVEHAVQKLIERLKKEDISKVLWDGVAIHPDFDGRTKLTDDWGFDFGFQSAWGATYAIQDRLCELLSIIDPLVIVQNDYQEEAYNFVGTRLVTYSDGELECFNSETDLADELEEIDEKIAALETGEENEEAVMNKKASPATLDQLEIQRERMINVIKIKMENASWAELFEDLPGRRNQITAAQD